MIGQPDDLLGQSVTLSVHMAAIRRMHFLQTKSDSQAAEIEKLTRQLEDTSTFSDLALGIIANRNTPPAYAMLYLSMISTYPRLLLGEPADIQVWLIRQNAGWQSVDSATRFLRDLVEVGAGEYDSGRLEGDERIGRFTPHLDVFLDVRNFNFKDLEKVKKNREAANQRNKAIRLRCVCGSTRMVYEGLCEECRQRYPLEVIEAKYLEVIKNGKA